MSRLVTAGLAAALVAIWGMVLVDALFGDDKEKKG